MDSLCENNLGKEGAKFCVYTSTYLVNFQRKIDIQLCMIQKCHSHKLINWILAEFCTNYQYASSFSYNIFMSSWNHVEFEVSCRSISWSTETSRVTIRITCNHLCINCYTYQSGQYVIICINNHTHIQLYVFQVCTIATTRHANFSQTTHMWLYIIQWQGTSTPTKHIVWDRSSLMRSPAIWYYFPYILMCHYVK